MTHCSQELFAVKRNFSNRSPQVVESYDDRRRGRLYSRRVAKPRRAGRVTWDGARLKEIREARGLSQGELSEESGVSPSELSRHERNATDSNPTVDVLARLAAALHVPLSSIVDAVGAYIPRPEEKAGREHAGNQRNAILEKRYAELSAGVDIDFPAEDSVEGDIHKALAVLNRALRRPQRSATEAPETPRRRAAPNT